MISLRSALHGALGLALLLTSCLPGDTRPPPGTVFYNASAASTVVSGVMTDDGWSVVFDDLVVSVRMSLEGSSCSQYYEPRYSRLLRLKTTEPQKVGLFYGLGECEKFGFELSAPASDDLLGAGVSEADRATFRSDGVDSTGTPAGAVALVAGHATRTTAGVTTAKQFRWLFRDRVEARDCAGITLTADTPQTFDLSFHPEVLLRGGTGDTDPLRFSALADADTITGNNDGLVSLEELALAGTGLAGTATLPGPLSLHDLVAQVLFPTIAQVNGTTGCVGLIGAPED